MLYVNGTYPTSINYNGTNLTAVYAKNGTSGTPQFVWPDKAGGSLSTCTTFTTIGNTWIKFPTFINIGYGIQVNQTSDIYCLQKKWLNGVSYTADLQYRGKYNPIAWRSSSMGLDKKNCTGAPVSQYNITFDSSLGQASKAGSFGNISLYRFVYEQDPYGEEGEGIWNRTRSNIYLIYSYSKLFSTPTNYVYDVFDNTYYGSSNLRPLLASFTGDGAEEYQRYVYYYNTNLADSQRKIFPGWEHSSFSHPGVDNYGRVTNIGNLTGSVPVYGTNFDDSEGESYEYTSLWIKFMDLLNSGLTAYDLSLDAIVDTSMFSRPSNPQIGDYYYEISNIFLGSVNFSSEPYISPLGYLKITACESSPRFNIYWQINSNTWEIRRRVHMGDLTYVGPWNSTSDSYIDDADFELEM